MFGRLVAWLRWTGVTLGFVVAIDAGDVRGTWFPLAATLLVLDSIWRTVRPVRLAPDRPAASLPFVTDLVSVLGAVGLTGGWESPFVLLLLVSVLVAGFGRGYMAAFSIAGAALAGVAVPAMIVGHGSDPTNTAAAVVLVLTATAAIAGYSRGLFVEAHQRQRATTDELTRLGEVNHHLLLLYQLAQALPASLDLNEAVVASRRHLGELAQFSVFAVLTTDDAGDEWRVELAEGLRIPESLTNADLPDPVRRAVHAAGGVVCEDLTQEGPGLDPASTTGVYVALHSRGRVLGVLAVERTGSEPFGLTDLRSVVGVADPLALGIDNARWFRRLRSLGAEEERVRIARDLHDRLAQSLVYISFELDRVVKRRGPDEQLEQLRDDVRRAVGELRETLVQLRSTVSVERTLDVLIREHTERFTRRTGIGVGLRLDGARRFPPRAEQEVLRVLQEALTNVEKHSGARNVTVQWQSRAPHARLVVHDDGCGFDPGGPPERDDSFGIIGMRERAETLGATLAVDSRPGFGTRLVLDLERADVPS